MRVSTVYACVKILYDSISQLPCHLMMRDGDNTSRKATDNTLYKILHDLPNSWMTSTEFFGLVTAHLSLRGNFYAHIARYNGRVKSIIPFPIDSIQKIEQRNDMTLDYTFQVGQNYSFFNSLVDMSNKSSKTVTFRSRDILHIRTLAMNGIVGLSPIEYARNPIGISLAADDFIGHYFREGLHPGAVIQHPAILEPEQHTSMRERLKEKYAGLGNSHKFMLLDEGMTINFPSMKLVDAEFLEQRQFTQSQIASIFRVPLILLQSTDNPTTFASAEQLMLTFVTHALTPIVTMIEKCIYRDILTDEEKEKFYVKFSMEGLLRGDIKTRYDAYATAIDKEIMSPNEVRELEDMNPYPGGDEYRTRTSTVRSTSDTGGDE